MCANYVPVTRASRLLQFFGITSAGDAPDADTFPMGLAPIIRRAPDGAEPESNQRYLETGAVQPRILAVWQVRLNSCGYSYNSC